MYKTVQNVTVAKSAAQADTYVLFVQQKVSTVNDTVRCRAGFSAIAQPLVLTKCQYGSLKSFKNLKTKDTNESCK